MEPYRNDIDKCRILVEKVEGKQGKAKHDLQKKRELLVRPLHCCGDQVVVRLFMLFFMLFHAFTA